MWLVYQIANTEASICEQYCTVQPSKTFKEELTHADTSYIYNCIHDVFYNLKCVNCLLYVDCVSCCRMNDGAQCLMFAEILSSCLIITVMVTHEISQATSQL